MNYPILKAGEVAIFNGKEFIPNTEDVMDAIKAQVRDSEGVPMCVYFIDTEGRLWGHSTGTGNTRCPRRLKKQLKKNGTYEKFMEGDFKGFDVENLNQK